MPDIVTRRLIMQKARNRTFTRRCIVLSRLVDTRFQDLFTPLAGFLFAFPSRYWFAIGRQVVFSLGRWSSQIPTGLLEPRGTQEPLRRPDPFAYRAVTVSGGPFQAASPWCRTSHVVVPQPRGSKLPRFGLFPVRSPLLGESRLISVPPGTEMFQFPGLAPLAR